MTVCFLFVKGWILISCKNEILILQFSSDNYGILAIVLLPTYNVQSHTILSIKLNKNAPMQHLVNYFVSVILHKFAIPTDPSGYCVKSKKNLIYLHNCSFS